MLVDARDTDGARLTDKQVRDETISFFIAGHATIAAALTWIAIVTSVTVLAGSVGVYAFVRYFDGRINRLVEFLLACVGSIIRRKLTIDRLHLDMVAGLYSQQ